MLRIFKFIMSGSTRSNIDRMMESARQLIDNGNSKQACEELEKLVKVHPDFGPAWHWLGATVINTGNLVRARQALEEAMRLLPGNDEVLESIGRLEVIEKQAAMSLRSGSTIMIDGNSVQTGNAVERNARELDAAERHPTTPICRICKKGARILPGSSPDSKNGARCARCSTFYCTHCIDNLLQYTSPIACLGCSTSHIHRAEGEGQRQYDGFTALYYEDSNRS